MWKKDYQNLHNYVNCVILIYRSSFVNKKKRPQLWSKEANMQRIRKIMVAILLGIIILVIAVLIGTAMKKAHQALVSLEKTNDPCLSYEAWIEIHEPEYQNSGDAQSAYERYVEENYSPEYRKAKTTYYGVGAIAFVMIITCFVVAWAIFID